MKYADSYEWDETFSKTNATATQYSGWFEVDFANELISDGEFIMGTRDGAATLIVTIERYVPYSANATVLTAHATVQADATTQNEKTGSAVGAGTTVIGTRVRYVFTLGGSWAGNVTCSVALKLYAKRN